ncbi:MAG: bifunctional hydroxymethylpyrimidine kinase/phosphomethylpyrimidine kinase [Nitrospirota bacterium]|nr:bifunctional hydroxymethylpyrimidine kinase/phosphomethylpyrimidine kinase [Nitrospirota bacterium]
MTAPSPPPRALTIAGSDPSGGAGLQADITVFTRLKVHPMAIPAALTVQNSAGVRAVTPLAPDTVIDALAAVHADMPPAATKTGMLGTDAVVAALADYVAENPLPNLVIDPILRASSGPGLLTDDGFATLRERLIPRATLITPNRYEAELLWGQSIPNAAAAERAAAALREAGAAVLITGGHLDDKGYIIDTLADESGITTWRHPRHPGPSPHGTGCALSAAITAYLAHGLTLRESVRRALAYTLTAVRTAAAPGTGRPYLGDGTTELNESPEEGTL